MLLTINTVSKITMNEDGTINKGKTLAYLREHLKEKVQEKKPIAKMVLNILNSESEYINEKLLINCVVSGNIQNPKDLKAAKKLTKEVTEFIQENKATDNNSCHEKRAFLSRKGARGGIQTYDKAVIINLSKNI